MSARQRLADAVFSSIAEMMLAYADEAVAVAWKEHGRQLDYSEASIDVLEAILAEQAAVDLDFQTRLWGGYFGEVIRRRYAGEWELTPYPGGAAAMPALAMQGSRLFPLMKVYRRLTLGEAEDVAAFYRLAARRLDKAAATA